MSDTLSLIYNKIKHFKETGDILKPVYRRNVLCELWDEYREVLKIQHQYLSFEIVTNQLLAFLKSDEEVLARENSRFNKLKHNIISDYLDDYSEEVDECQFLDSLGFLELTHQSLYPNDSVPYRVYSICYSFDPKRAIESLHQSFIVKCQDYDLYHKDESISTQYLISDLEELVLYQKKHPHLRINSNDSLSSYLTSSISKKERDEIEGLLGALV